MANDFHPGAAAEKDLAGPSATVGALARVCPRAEVGRNTVVADYAFIGDDVRIGEGVTIWLGVHLPGNVVVEDGAVLDVLVAVVGATERAWTRRSLDYPRTLIREGARIGAHSTLLAGVTVGRYAVVEPGSWLTADVPDFARAAGNPAQVEGWVCACGAPLALGTGPDGRVACACGRVYEIADGGLVEAEVSTA